MASRAVRGHKSISRSAVSSAPQVVLIGITYYFGRNWAATPKCTMIYTNEVEGLLRSSEEAGKPMVWKVLEGPAAQGHFVDS